MSYQTGFSFAVEAEGGGSRVEMSSYGLCVVDFDLPLLGEPYTETVDVPGKVGGYSYTNNPRPAELTLYCVVEGTTNADMRSKIDSVGAALVATTKYQIHIDGEADYWIGKRISGIQSGRYYGGMRACRFEIIFICENPTPQSVGA